MRFPLITRSHHDDVVEKLTSQMIGMAKLLYPDGVPEEFQLLVGIKIPPSENVTAAPERELTDDEKAIAEMKAEQAADAARLERIRRTRPSQLGPEIARQMQKRALHAATAARPDHPATIMFASAEAEARNQA